LKIREKSCKIGYINPRPLSGRTGGHRMVEVKVCVGSSCHMKGSYQVLKTFQELIAKNDLKDEVALKASFCMGRCLEGISVMVDDTPVQNVGFQNAQDVFYKEIYPKVKAGGSAQ